MGISLKAISEKFKDFNPQIYIYNEESELEAAELLDKAPVEFEPGVLYVGKISDLSFDAPKNCHVNFLCIADGETPQEYRKDNKFNFIILEMNSDIKTIFKITREIFSTHRRMLKKSSKLMEMMLKSYNLDQIVDSASKILGNPIAVSNANYELLAYTKNILLENRFWSDSIKLGRIPDYFLNFTKAERIIEKIYKNKSTYKLFNPFMNHNTLMGIAEAENKVLAHIAIIDFLKPFGEEDTELFSLLCKIIAAEMQRAKIFGSSRSIIYEHFIMDLLDGKINSREILTERISHTGLKLKHYLYILTINIHQLERGNTTIEYARNQLESLLCINKSVVYNDNIVFIIDRGMEYPLSEYELNKLCGYLKKNSMQGGLSRCFTKLMDLDKYYQQSLNAIRVGRETDRDKVLYKYEDYAVFHMMQQCSGDFNIKDFCHPAIFSLVDYDKKYDTCFTESLFAYLENAWNVVESAKALNIHRNSMGYRLEKIQEILKISLKDKNTGFHIQLSLKILEYTGDIAIKAAETVRNKESR